MTSLAPVSAGSDIGRDIVSYLVRGAPEPKLKPSRDIQPVTEIRADAVEQGSDTPEIVQDVEH